MDEVINKSSMENYSSLMGKASNSITTVENDTSEFYYKAQKYWSKIPATISGMLGGLGYLHNVDIQSSNKFLRELKIEDVHKKYALDCGAGIGRVSKYLLMPKFAKVDLVEQDLKFVKKARTYCIKNSSAAKGYHNRLGEIYNCGLQEFQPTPNKYDLVWSQWVLGHLNDNDLLRFFQRIRYSLTAGGYFVIKENVTSTGKVDKDDEDSSVIRPLKIYKNFLKKSGFRITKKAKVTNFPKDFYTVRMIAAQPIFQ